ncbi:MAG: phosphotransferase [Ferruginibacter sp.]|nr:phosphotransferase [Cytophagales bacterium]
MDLKDKFKALYPEVVFLEARTSPELVDYLRRKGWLAVGEEVVSVQKPGEGNMNAVVRVVTSRRSFILKQARPWVQKYPRVSAPMGRTAVEARFYERIAGDEVLRTLTPAMLGFDAPDSVLALEDLGAGTDFTYLYQPNQLLGTGEVASLTRFLSRLHQLREEPGQGEFLANQSMKALNHEHIFQLPFQEENGLDLDAIQEGLRDRSLPYRRDAVLKGKLSVLGDRYLRPGPTLIHGDYYPGSWLKGAAGLRVIDPEFGHFGRPEFDVGVMVAHFKLARLGEPVIREALDGYQPPDGFEYSLMTAFAGVEVLRRLLGLAQLPLSLSLDEKEALLEEAAASIMKP